MRLHERPDGRAACATSYACERWSSSWKRVQRVLRAALLAVRAVRAVLLRAGLPPSSCCPRARGSALPRSGRVERARGPRGPPRCAAPRRTRRRGRRSRTSSSCVPRSTTRPPSSTTMEPQRRAAATRWVMRTSVRRAAWRSMASRMAASVLASTAESGSSSTSTGGSRSSAARAPRAGAGRRRAARRAPPRPCRSPRGATRPRRAPRPRRGAAHALHAPRRESGSSSGVADVAGHRGREQERVLLRVADALAHGLDAAARRCRCRRGRPIPRGVGRRRASSTAMVLLPRARAPDDGQRRAGRAPRSPTSSTTVRLPYAKVSPLDPHRAPHRRRGWQRAVDDVRDAVGYLLEPHVAGAPRAARSAAATKPRRQQRPHQAQEGEPEQRRTGPWRPPRW